jgi:hypothetical protein
MFNFDAASGSFTMPLWALAILLALVVLFAAFAIARGAAGRAFRGLVIIAVLGFAGWFAWSLMGRSAQTEKIAERQSFEQRAAARAGRGAWLPRRNGGRTGRGGLRTRGVRNAGLRCIGRELRRRADRAPFRGARRRTAKQCRLRRAHHTDAARVGGRPLRHRGACDAAAGQLRRRSMRRPRPFAGSKSRARKPAGQALQCAGRQICAELGHHAAWARGRFLARASSHRAGRPDRRAGLFEIRVSVFVIDPAGQHHELGVRCWRGAAACGRQCECAGSHGAAGAECRFHCGGAGARPTAPAGATACRTPSGGRITCAATNATRPDDTGAAAVIHTLVPAY